MNAPAKRGRKPKSLVQDIDFGSDNDELIVSDDDLAPPPAFEQVDLTEGNGPAPKKAKTTKKAAAAPKKKQYCPAYRSGAYAILMAMYECAQRGEHQLTKSRLQYVQDFFILPNKKMSRVIIDSLHSPIRMLRLKTRNLENSFIPHGRPWQG
jgi:hypothetical protein